ncbi:hypothetical protein [Gordonia sp. JH63]|uniref:hypothetical protein n=1 Tax=Gordonia sp. JH63 TaxID=2698900 RepID=UPI001EF0EC36|nr:hypothetical protein [Gordonia sp. JH63]
MVDRRASDELYVLDLCDEILGVPEIRQARFDWLRGDPSPRLPPWSNAPGRRVLA